MHNPFTKRAAKRKLLGAAIVELGIAFDTMKNNEPINRREGNIAQADFEKANAESYKLAGQILAAAGK